jgi:acetyltransferase-like isoleucine patch superfamily enzyme
MGPRAVRLLLRAVQAWDRRRLRRLCRRHPGLFVHPQASTNFARARFALEEGATVVIGAGAVTERRREGVRFHVAPGARIEVGEGSWLRSEIQPVHLVAFPGARIRIGRECFLNGCHLSAKSSVALDWRASVGPGARVFDADQHDLDDARPERSAPVSIGACAWIAADATVLRGVSIGEHCVVGTRSVVTRSLPPHTLAAGAPARPYGQVGDRSQAR